MTKPSWYQRTFGWVPKPVRQVIVLVVGSTLLLLGVAGMVLPVMPGAIFIPLALAILAAEFAWAARWLLKLRHTAKEVQERATDGWNEVAGGPWPAVYLLRIRSAAVAICSRPWVRRTPKKGAHAPSGRRSTPTP